MTTETKEMLERLKSAATNDRDATLALLMLVIERVLVLDEHMDILIENQKILVETCAVLATAGRVTTDHMEKLNQTVELIQQHYIQKKVM